MPAKELYKNEYLFSEAYLADITQIEANPDVTATLNTLKEFREFAHNANLNDWNLSYIHEVLFTLKFNLKTVDDNLSELYELGNTDSPISICVSLLPGENLDNTLLGTNYAEKVIRNLRKYNLKWGILTNGDFWRIYHTEEPTPYETFLEIDLKEIQREGNYQAFQLFAEFLQAENFVLDENRICRFDQFKQESQIKIDYIEEELSKALKQAEEGGKGILASLCQGYIRFLKNSVNANYQDDNFTDAIYRSSMLYMFRLLFLLYAEARNLLDDDEMQMLDVIKNNAFHGSKASTASFKSYELWKLLNGLFGHIDEIYNGGLFNPAENQYTKFIQENRLDDYCLASVIYHLCHYAEKSGETKKISYRDLSVRHLGSLYEGLLEHKLRVAEEDTEVKHSKKEIKYIPQSKGGIIKKGNHILAGDVYFVGDKGERKTTGSYYTPEDVVEYIVSNTVREKLEEVKRIFLEKNKRILHEIDKSINEVEKMSLQDTFFEELDYFLNEEVLKISVLDPAMGSGHFLVNATNAIANFITETMNEFGFIDKIRDTCTIYWRRRVVENCIYGVDLNPLAVELAKLSLWIFSMSKGKPLSFIDHHLKLGNSLVGCKLEDLDKVRFLSRKTEMQGDIYDLMKNKELQKDITEAVNNLIKIQDIETNIRKNVAEKGFILRCIDEQLKPYKYLCDYYIEYILNKDLKKDEYMTFLSSLNINEFKKRAKLNSKTLSNRKFFHWELEYPEIMINRQGFDCIICNPPYSDIDINIKKYISNKFLSSSSNEVYALFLEHALMNLAKDGSYNGFIVPMAITSSYKLKNLRDLIVKSKKIWKIASFDRIPDALFGPNVKTYNSIVLFYTNSPSANIFMTPRQRWFKHERKELFNELEYYDATNLNHELGFAKIGSVQFILALEKLFKVNKKMQDVIVKGGNWDGGNLALHFKRVAYNWLCFSSELPPISDSKGNPTKSDSIVHLIFKGEDEKWASLAILNSLSFFCYWLAYDDAFHVSKKIIGSFPVSPYLFDKEEYTYLVSIGGLLEDEMKKFVEYKVNAGKRIGNYNIRKCRNITDKIDLLIASKIGLNENKYLESIYDFSNKIIRTEINNETPTY